MSQTISKLADKCKKCPNVKMCNNKRMEACALAEISKPNAVNTTVSATIPLTQPMLRAEHSVTIGYITFMGI